MNNTCNKDELYNKISGVFLLFCIVFSLFLSSLQGFDWYQLLWQKVYFSYSIKQWINDGLMTFFFLFIGLELKKEIFYGELSPINKAWLPVFAAIGGMIVPCLFYCFFTWNTNKIIGAAIPMATDITFALAILSLLGRKIPTSLKVFLMALAIIDDLGAIIVIAFFYSESGIHSSIIGVLLAFVIPQRYFHSLHQKLKTPVTFIIIPLFILSSTAIPLYFSHILNVFSNDFSAPLWGIFIGSIIGKPLGITMGSWLCIQLKLSSLPKNINWKHIIGIGFLGGIGFSMSLFINTLAFGSLQSNTLTNLVTLIILITSCISGLIGFFILRYLFKIEL